MLNGRPASATSARGQLRTRVTYLCHVRSWRISRHGAEVVGTAVPAKSGLSLLLNSNRNVAHRDAGGSCGRTRSRLEGQQQGREFASAGSAAGAQTTEVQVTRLGTTPPQHPLAQPTTLSITSVISSNDPCRKSLEPYRSTLGNARARRPDLGSELAKL